MQPQVVERLIHKSLDLWPSSEGIEPEITLEANPESASKKALLDFRSAGVNRLSLGVQSFDNDALAFLGRTHEADVAKQAAHWSRRIFARFSIDLISALPKQSLHAWKQEIEQALECNPDHLSIYSLSIKPGTPFYKKWRAGLLQVLNDKISEAMFSWTRRKLERQGMPAYEVSNHARKNAQSRHNLLYWRSEEWIGVGPGAHARYKKESNRYESAQINVPDRWLMDVESGKSGAAYHHPLEWTQQRDEFFLSGLRLKEGVSLSACRKLLGKSLQDSLHAQNLKMLLDSGFLQQNSCRLQATEQGIVRLESVLRLLLDC